MMKQMLHWQKDTDLAGFQDAAALAQLSVDEQDEWQALGADAGENGGSDLEGGGADVALHDQAAGEGLAEGRL